MPIFYHMQRKNVSAFRVGKTYTFDTQLNFHTQELFARDLLLPMAGLEPMTVDSVITDYLGPDPINYFRRIKKSGYSSDEKGLLTCALRALEHQAKLLREYTFEEVRKADFPLKPSRHNCIWLIPHDINILNLWCASAPESTFKIFEVEAKGKFHFGSTKYLRPSVLGADAFRERARRYWSEEPDPNTTSVEILCVGNVTVLKQIGGNPETFLTRAKAKFFG